MLSYISHDQLQQDKGEVGGVNSPGAVVMLHLADGQQHRKSVRWEMIPFPLADVELHITWSTAARRG